MPSEQPYLPSSAALTPEPQLDSWEEHQHLMNPMFLQVWRVGPRIVNDNVDQFYVPQSPDELDLPPLDPELLEHRRHQVKKHNKQRTPQQC